MFEIVEYIALALFLIPLAMIIFAFNLIVLFALLKFYSVLMKKLSRNKYSKYVSTNQDKSPYFSVAFLHPFCNSGGGGERVLWSAVKALQDS